MSKHDDDAKADKGKAKDKSDPQDTGGTQDVAQDSLKHDQQVKAKQDQEARFDPSQADVSQGAVEEGKQDHEFKRTSAPIQGPMSTMGASGPEPKGDPAPRVKLSQLGGLRTQLDQIIERSHQLHEKVDDAGLMETIAKLAGAAHELRTAIGQVFGARGASPDGEPQPEQQPEQPADPAAQQQPV